MFLNLFIWIIWFSFIASFPCKHVQMTFFHAGRISYFKVRFCMLHHYFKIAFPLTVTLQNVLHKITYSFIMDGSFLSEIYLVILVRFSSLVWDIFKLWCIFFSRIFITKKTFRHLVLQNQFFKIIFLQEKVNFIYNNFNLFFVHVLCICQF